MDKVRKASDEEIDALNRDIERIFAGMPPEEAEAEESERRTADSPDLINGSHIEGDIADDLAKGLIPERMV